METKSIDYPLTTRLAREDIEALKQISELEDRSQAAIIRIAVREYIERQMLRVHPLSLSDAISLGTLLEIGEPHDLINRAKLLVNATHFSGKGGVYLLIHSETKELYVGSSVDLAARMAHHRHCIAKGEHKNTSLSSWTLDTAVMVVLEVFESGSESNVLRMREQVYIDQLKISTTTATSKWCLVNQGTAARGEGSSPSKQTTKHEKAAVNNVSVVNAVEEYSNERASDLSTEENDGSTETYDFIQDYILPILEEEKSSQELLQALDTASPDDYERGVQFIREYDSTWLKRLAGTGRFPWVEKLLG